MKGENRGMDDTKQAKKSSRKMTKTKYCKKIKQMCIDAGTYAPYFDRIIMELAEILLIKDAAEEQYIASGACPVIEYTNKGGATNLVKNPSLVVILECKTNALAYWRDLGLTPKGLKSLGEPITKDKEKGFGDILASLGI